MNKLQAYVNQKDYENFNDRLLDALEDYDFRESTDLEDGNKVYKIVLNPEGERTIAFVGGIHGDERGGPYGIVRFLEEKRHVSEHLRVILIPIAAPSSFRLNTRENADKVDINRHFYEEDAPIECKCLWDYFKDENLELIHTLHEDPDMVSYYCYYSHHRQICEGLRDLGKKYFNILPDGDVYGDTVKDGLVSPPHIHRGTFEDRLLEEKGVPYIVSETPGKMSLKKREELNSEMIRFVINNIN